MSEEDKVTATETGDDGKDQVPSQKPQRTERETTEYNLKKQAEKLKELGGDPVSVLGIKPEQKQPIQVDDSLPDDAPLTVGTLREIQRKDARKSAEQMADAIADEAERERVKSELRYIVPSGDAQADFRRAQAAANAERNAKIAQEAARKTAPRITAAGGSQSAPVEDEFVPTPEEAVFMRPPYNMSKEKILAMRPKA